MNDLVLIIIYFIIGLVFIVKGADWFVDAAIWIAKATGVPGIVIGGTIVSMATTLPELVVSSYASWSGNPGIAIGNAVGSSICNIGLVLGCCAIVKPISIDRKYFYQKGLIMLVSAFFLIFFLKDNYLASLEGKVLLLLLIFYLVTLIVEIKNESNNYQDLNQITGSAFKNIIKFVLGASLVIIGGKYTVDNGEILANILGIPERIVSLTMIAIGTSLPELTTSITAIIKGYQGLSVGNILGANTLNILLVIGTSTAISPLRVSPQVKLFDVPFMIFLMIILIFYGLSDSKIERWEGGLLFVFYIFYLIILWLIFFN